MLSAKLERNGPFVKAMADRLNSLRAKKTLAIRAIVPNELRWWYWLEWGTAARGITPHASGHAYEIRLGGLQKTYPLRFWDYQGKYRNDGKPGWYSRDLIIHPGIHPRRFVAHSMPDILADCGAALHAYLMAGGSPKANDIQAFMMLSFPLIIRTYLHANLAIGTTFNAKYRRSEDPHWARLGGQLATDVFDANLKFKDTSV